MRRHGTQRLETSRLILRRFDQEDAPAMYRTWASDPQVTRFLRWEPHPDEAEPRRILTQWAAAYGDPSFYQWAVERRSDGALLGVIGVVREEEGERLEPAYVLGRAYWGQGYTTEALAAVVNYLFESEGETVLSCCHAVDNPASGRVMSKCGFSYCCDAVYYKYNGTQIPCKCYELTKETYDARRND